MTIQQIAKERIVEEMVYNVAKGHGENDENLKDLIQDIYYTLLKKQDKLTPLPLKEIRYYIARLAVNNICSKTSRYYYNYKKIKNLPLEVWAREEEDKHKEKDV